MPSNSKADSASWVLATTADSVMTITLSRPDKLNALTYPMLARLRELLAEAAGDPSVRAVLLRGEGRSFCAGDDLDGMGEFPPGMVPVEKSYRVGYLAVVRAIRELAKPVVAGIQGHCLGAGFELALACDVRLVSQDAQLGTRFIRIGLASGAYLLPRIVGVTRAVQMLFTGRDIDAAAAAEWGIATELIEPEHLDDACMRWSSELAQMPTSAIGYVKRLVYASSEMSLEEGIREASFVSALAHETSDYREAKDAWAKRRQPQFTGR
jgi:enoyl-CoA hydratase/carnithine racemase